jgi:hypothetical protein
MNTDYFQKLSFLKWSGFRVTLDRAFLLESKTSFSLDQIRMNKYRLKLSNVNIYFEFEPT